MRLAAKNLYFQKTSDGKQILREMMARHIPSHITQAAKQGFSSPDASWFKGEILNSLSGCLQVIRAFMNFLTLIRCES